MGERPVGVRSIGSTMNRQSGEAVLRACRQVHRNSQPSNQPGAMHKHSDREPLQHLIQVKRDPLVSSTAVHDKVELGSSSSDGVSCRTL